MWITINGFDRTMNIDPQTVFEFVQNLSDPASDFKFDVDDAGSLLSIDTEQEVIIWDEFTPPEPVNVAATPAHNCIFDYVFTNTTDWVASGLSIITRNSGNFVLTFANSATTVTLLSQTSLFGYIHPGQQYMVSGYITGGGTISNIQYQIQMQFLDAGGNNLGSAITSTGTPLLGTLQVFVTAVAPAGALY